MVTSNDKPDAAQRIRLTNLSAEAFVSKTDRGALRALQSLPLLPTLMRKFNEYSMDHLWYVENTANSIRCGPRQYKTLYNILRECCDLLDVAEPELYLRYDFANNAYTAGMERTFIVLNSSLVDNFTDDELRYVIGHELGHIKCGHLLYLNVAILLMPLLQKLGIAGRVLSAVVAAFCEWMRQAEFSCDRAGLLACQEPNVAFSAIMKLGGGGSRLQSEASVEEFIAQARRYSELGGIGAVAKIYNFLTWNWILSHPQVVYRAKGLDDWINSGAYAKILAGDYARDLSRSNQLGAQAVCVQCGKTVSATVEACPECGHSFAVDIEPGTSSVCRDCGGIMLEDDLYCKHCGTWQL